jgi:hypothetical protein
VKRIVHKNGLLHVETPNGIVNIRVGLTDNEGRSVDSIECLPDSYVGEPRVTLDGKANTRMIREKEA